MTILNGDEVIDGKYRIVRLIGEGGMGAVYEGLHTLIHRRVAIKVLHAGVVERAEAAMRFEREAQAAGRIGSPHIVEVLDLGSLPSGARYMVMEFLEGESLGSRIERGVLSPIDLYPIAAQLLDGLIAAHGTGIVHRDLKPDNVFLQQRPSGDFVKLLDFGISKFGVLNDDSGLSMTRTGAVMGTPFYMAPEQARGSKQVDHRADLYAVGVILYECLTGQVPFRASSFNELMFKIALEDPRPLRSLAPHVDEPLAAIVTKAMSREPAQRFSTAVELRQALTSWAKTVDPVRASLVSPPLTGSPSTLPSNSQNQGPDSLNVGATTATWSSNDSGISEMYDTHMRNHKRKRVWMGLLAAGMVVGASALAFGILRTTEPPTSSTSVGSPNPLPPPAATPVDTQPKVEPVPAIDVEKIEAERRALAEKLDREEEEPVPVVTRARGGAAAPVRESRPVAQRRRATPTPTPHVEPTPPPKNDPPPKSDPPPKQDKPVGKVGERPIRTTL
ncbi:MAG: protein kinase [Myxococcota bacterium]|nr:protein kinase [Myxococcota bacterium]